MFCYIHLPENVEELKLTFQTFTQNTNMNAIKNDIMNDQNCESFICNNLERKMCDKTQFRDNMVAWIMAMQKTKNGTMGLNVDNIYTPSRDILTVPSSQQKMDIQVTFADNNILLWRMDSWPKKIRSGMSQVDRERALIRSCIENMQDELMRYMNMVSDVISVSSENSFQNDLILSPTTACKTSSENGTKWTTDDEMDGYKTGSTFSDMDVISDNETSNNRKRKRLNFKIAMYVNWCKR